MQIVDVLTEVARFSTMDTIWHLRHVSSKFRSAVTLMTQTWCIPFLYAETVECTRAGYFRVSTGEVVMVDSSEPLPPLREHIRTGKAVSYQIKREEAQDAATKAIVLLQANEGFNSLPQRPFFAVITDNSIVAHALYEVLPASLMKFSLESDAAAVAPKSPGIATLFIPFGSLTPPGGRKRSEVEENQDVLTEDGELVIKKGARTKTKSGREFIPKSAEELPSFIRQRLLSGALMSRPPKATAKDGKELTDYDAALLQVGQRHFADVFNYVFDGEPCVPWGKRAADDRSPLPSEPPIDPEAAKSFIDDVVSKPFCDLTKAEIDASFRFALRHEAGCSMGPQYEFHPQKNSFDFVFLESEGTCANFWSRMQNTLFRAVDGIASQNITMLLPSADCPVRVGQNRFGQSIYIEASRLVEPPRSVGTPQLKRLYCADDEILGVYHTVQVSAPCPLVRSSPWEKLGPTSVAQAKQHVCATPWLLYGHAYSYSSAHTEPEGTHIWAHVYEGKKRWYVLLPSSSSHQQHVWQSFDQNPGETIFLPPHVPHVVVNLKDRTLAVARNFVGGSA